jgi:hypothetical protein
MVEPLQAMRAKSSHRGLQALEFSWGLQFPPTCIKLQVNRCFGPRVQADEAPFNGWTWGGDKQAGFLFRLRRPIDCGAGVRYNLTK